MLVKPISARFVRGRSMPAIRAIKSPLLRNPLALPLLVLGVLANDAHHALAPDNLAFRTNFPHRGTNFHFGPTALSLIPVSDPPTRQVVRRQLHGHLVARQDANEILPHLPGDMRQDPVLILELDAKHRVGQRLNHRRYDFDRLFFSHIVSWLALLINMPRPAVSFKPAPGLFTKVRSRGERPSVSRRIETVPFRPSVALS